MRHEPRTTIAAFDIDVDCNVMCNSVFVASHAMLAARAIDATEKSKEIVSRASNTSFNVTFAHSTNNIVSIHILHAIAGND